MGINWFEGGRRISHLFMALLVLGGAAYVVFQDAPMATLSIRGPTMPWFVADEDCKSPSYERFLWDYDWGGDKRGLQLCFLALDNGKIPYAVAPTPPKELARRAKQRAADDADDKAREARGEPPLIRLRMETPWFYNADEDDPRVQSYIAQSEANLQITPELRQQLRKGHSAAKWRARKQALGDATPWVAGLCIFIWILTAVLGWIIRGFAGIPSGHDFRLPQRRIESQFAARED